MNDLEQFIRDLNHAWTDSRYDELYGYFHKQAVMLPPGSDRPVIGSEAMVQSCRQFGEMAVLLWGVVNLYLFV